MLLEHLLAYTELLKEELAGALAQLRRRALGLALACVGGLMALELGCLWIIAWTWDGPNRLTAVAALFGGFLLLAVGGLLYALMARAPPLARPFERLVAEWHADLVALAAVQRHEPAAGASSAPQPVADVEP